MKLKESFMTSDTIDYFMSQPSGANYVVLYQMLCLKTINTDGRLSRQIGEVIIPYDIPKIQRDLKWFSADTIRVALNLYKAVGLIYEDVDGTLVLADHDSLVGSETDWGAKKRRQRNTSELPSGDNVPTDVPQIVPTEIEKELETRDRDREQSSDIDKEARDRQRAISCAELQSSSAPPIASMILNDGTYFNVSVSDFNKWVALYPAVDVKQELCKMVGWCDANPKKRKTKSGIRRFINNWLAGEQDKGGRYRGGNAPHTGGSGNIFADIMEGSGYEPK
nr:MAG: replisome organizer [Bacteriophage sp.]